MQKQITSLLAGVLTFLIFACGDENPTDFSGEKSASQSSSSYIQEVESSSSFTENSSSSLESSPSSSDTIDFSSSSDIFTSSSDTKSSSSISSSSSLTISYGELIDERDGQVYKTVKIGNLTWMAENLNYTYLQKNDDFDSTSWCYNNEPNNCTIYGRLYTWDAALDCKSYKSINECYDNIYNKYWDMLYSRGICPKGWHISSDIEWSNLLEFTNQNANTIKSTYGWEDDGNGSDNFKFKILPAGEYTPYENSWIGIGNSTCFWTTTQTSVALTFDSSVILRNEAFTFCLSNQNSKISTYNIPKSHALSVRCVKDN